MDITDIPRELRGEYRRAREQGWEVTRTNGCHLRWQPRRGEAVITGSGRSEGRGVQNAKAKLRQAGLRDAERTGRRPQTRRRGRRR
jgi:hypothetical protein